MSYIKHYAINMVLSTIFMRIILTNKIEMQNE